MKFMKFILIMILLLLAGCNVNTICIKHGDISVINSNYNVTIIGDGNLRQGQYEVNMFGCNQNSTGKTTIDDLTEVYHDTYK